MMSQNECPYCRGNYSSIITKEDAQMAIDHFQDRLPCGVSISCLVIFGVEKVKLWLFRIAIRLMKLSKAVVIER